MDMGREHFWKTLSTGSSHLLDDSQRSSGEVSIAAKIDQSVPGFLQVHGRLLNLAIAPERVLTTPQKNLVNVFILFVQG